MATYADQLKWRQIRISAVSHRSPLLSILMNFQRRRPRTLLKSAHDSSAPLTLFGPPPPAHGSYPIFFSQKTDVRLGTVTARHSQEDLGELIEAAKTTFVVCNAFREMLGYISTIQRTGVGGGTGEGGEWGRVCVKALLDWSVWMT